MPIINGNRFQKREKLKVEISSETLDKIKEYCKWANIGDNVGYFLEEAVTFVLSKDADWKRFKKTSKKRIEKMQEPA